jgi:phosphate starvation-inducible PhoH-like protein
MEEFNKRRKNPTSFDIHLNEEQKEVKRQIMEKDISILTGKAGTGKTLVGCNVALDLLINSYGNGSYEKIVILRPAVTAGEEIGFLKGSKDEKMQPFMRPIIDNFRRLMKTPSKAKHLQKLIDENTIEIIPIAFSKGITYTNTIVLVDEAEDITTKQMKLILTRLGIKSKMIITGDIGQTDITEKSGLVPLLIASEHIERMIHCKLEQNHRATIVADILKYYDK